MMDIVDDYYLGKLVEERLSDGEEPISVNMDDL
jgi:predicted DNA-binding protein